MKADSIKKTLIVSLGVCLVCSVLVSTAAVSLSGIQKENKKIDKRKNILMAGDLLEGSNKKVDQLFKEKIKPVIVDLSSGKVVEPTEELKPSTFNIDEMAASTEYGKDIPADEDIADIKRKPKYMIVYEVLSGSEIEKYIFPIYGKGLWSTMYGFIALDKDLKTIKGFTFYSHGETPGLGGEVDNPKWKAQWKGKKAFDEDGEVAITVLKGQVDKSNPDSKYQIDGLSGSTLTTRGIDNLVKFWLGENGYGPFIDGLKKGGQDVKI